MDEEVERWVGVKYGKGGSDRGLRERKKKNMTASSERRYRVRFALCLFFFFFFSVLS